MPIPPLHLPEANVRGSASASLVSRSARTRSSASLQGPWPERSSTARRPPGARTRARGARRRLGIVRARPKSVAGLPGCHRDGDRQRLLLAGAVDTAPSSAVAAGQASPDVCDAAGDDNSDRPRCPGGRADRRCRLPAHLRRAVPLLDAATFLDLPGRAPYGGAGAGMGEGRDHGPAGQLRRGVAARPVRRGRRANHPFIFAQHFGLRASARVREERGRRLRERHRNDLLRQHGRDQARAATDWPSCRRDTGGMRMLAVLGVPWASWLGRRLDRRRKSTATRQPFSLRS